MSTTAPSTPTIVFANIFPANLSWEQIVERINTIPPLPRDQLRGFLDYLHSEFKKAYPNPLIIAGATLLLKKWDVYRIELTSEDIIVLETYCSYYNIRKLYYSPAPKQQDVGTRIA